VPETAIVGRQYDAPDIKLFLVDLEYRLLPYLVDGVLDSNADSEGAVWYRLVGEIGKPPRALENLNAPDDDLCDLYQKSLDYHLALRCDWAPRRLSEIHIPMPTGVGPEKTPRRRSALAKAATPKRRKK
jgi:hypothetical protein